MSDITSNELADLKTESHTVRDGTSITYAHLKNEGAPKITLVHSLAMDHKFWIPVIKELRNSAEIIAVDCRGHGASEKAAGPYSLELFASDVADVLEQTGWEKSLVAGASLGGAVALQFAVKFPNRTSALGLIDTTSCYGPTAPDDWAKRANAARTKGLQSMTDFQESRWFSDKFRKDNPDIVQFCIDTFVANDLDSYSATCHMLGGFDLRSNLNELTMPTAVIVGEEDYATPLEMAQVLHEGISGSTLEVIQGGRHLTPLEHPTLIADRLITLARKA
ncbi:alpha/beta hydrolase [Sneathiella sp.]|uniref:alpha/beta fold hydrolase n=1 Tax=Sneathiella sp. TaxID=1964365 RepID=UPI0025D11B8F|nr:alpha/beta hydrolase [Sneathiella sp.]